jgi:hypothetical protein
MIIDLVGFIILLLFMMLWIAYELKKISKNT